MPYLGHFYTFFLFLMESFEYFVNFNTCQIAFWFRFHIPHTPYIALQSYYLYFHVIATSILFAIRILFPLSISAVLQIISVRVTSNKEIYWPNYSNHISCLRQRSWKLRKLTEIFWLCWTKVEALGSINLTNTLRQLQLPLWDVWSNLFLSRFNMLF